MEHDVKEIMVEYTKKKRRLCGALWTTMHAVKAQMPDVYINCQTVDSGQ